MTEDKNKSYRLFKVAKELNVASSTLQEYLHKSGHELEDNNPNAKLSSEMYDLLVREFAPDKKSRERAEKIKKKYFGSGQQNKKQRLTPMPDPEPEGAELTVEELKSRVLSQKTSAKPPVQIPAEQSAKPEGKEGPPDAGKAAHSDASQAREATETPQPAASSEVKTDAPPPGAEEQAKAEDESPFKLKVVGKIDLDKLPSGKKKGRSVPYSKMKESAREKVEKLDARRKELEAARQAEEDRKAEEKAAAEKAAAEKAAAEQAAADKAAAEQAEMEKRAAEEKAKAAAETPPATEAKQTQPDDAPGEVPAAKPEKTETPAGKAPQDAPADEGGDAESSSSGRRRRRRRSGKSSGDETPAPSAGTPGADAPPGKAAEKEAQPAAGVKSDSPAADAPGAPQPAEAKTDDGANPEGEAQTEEEVIRASDRAPQLTGLKIMGKIELPSTRPAKGKKKDAAGKKKEKGAPRRGARPDATTGRTDAPGGAKKDENADKAKTGEAGGDASKRRRKRKRKSGADAPTPSATTGGGSTKGKKGKKGQDVSQRDVTQKLKSTFSAMNRGGAGGGRATGRKHRKIKRAKRAEQREMEQEMQLAQSNVLEVTEFLTANELANLMDVNVNMVLAKCMELDMIVSINQRIDSDIIELLAGEFGYEVKFISLEESFIEEEEEDDPATLEPRPPIVTVMGHVDHGKTSLLDYIRSANVIAGEAGGITQHIGAYEVTLDDGRMIAFLDTPGHEAFTAMRARGANITDVAIIIISADDDVMPQTKEAISHAQAANVPMVFAINKVDKEGANPERIKEQLSAMNILVEDWGGKYQCQEISAKFGQGVDELLEKVLLEAEILDLKANPKRKARGTVIEARLDKGRGVVTNLLVQNGELKVGDVLLANSFSGRVKAMFDEREKRVKTAGPSTPVQVLGLDGVPQAGDKFQVMDNDREARELANKRQQLAREQTIRMQKHITLEEIARRSADGDFQELNVIVKGDVDGSVEALADSLIKLSTNEVAVKIVMKGVGQISESDVNLAASSDAIILGFQVRPSANARRLAQSESIDVRMYSVIYDAINEVKDALEGLLKPKIVEEVVGAAEVKEIFKITGVGSIAGCIVSEGKINRSGQVRLVREGIVQYTGNIGSLRRFKDDVKEVLEGQDCGIGIENYNDVKVGDVIEVFTTEEIKRTID